MLRLLFFSFLISIFLFGCGAYSIEKIKLYPNKFLSKDSCIVLEDRIDNVTILFSNGICFFTDKDLMKNQDLFYKNDTYNCKYCWGKYLIQNNVITVFKPLSTGYLNLPKSYKIQELKYKIDNNTIVNINDTTEKIISYRTNSFIDSKQVWFVSK